MGSLNCLSGIRLRSSNATSSTVLSTAQRKTQVARACFFILLVDHIRKLSFFFLREDYDDETSSLTHPSAAILEILLPRGLSPLFLSFGTPLFFASFFQSRLKVFFIHFRQSRSSLLLVHKNYPSHHADTTSFQSRPLHVAQKSCSLPFNPPWTTGVSFYCLFCLGWKFCRP